MERDVSKQAGILPGERKIKLRKLDNEQKNWDVIIACEMGLYSLVESDIVWVGVKAVVIEIYIEMGRRNERNTSNSKNGFCKLES
jgi:hypothetical protein